MSELEQADVPREVYILGGKDDTVQTAKSQFAEEYDVPYSETNGSIVHTSGGSYRGARSDYPAYCVVIHNPEI